MSWIAGGVLDLEAQRDRNAQSVRQVYGAYRLALTA